MCSAVVDGNSFIPRLISGSSESSLSSDSSDDYLVSLVQCIVKCVCFGFLVVFGLILLIVHCCDKHKENVARSRESINADTTRIRAPLFSEMTEVADENDPIAVASGTYPSDQVCCFRCCCEGKATVVSLSTG